MYVYICIYLSSAGTTSPKIHPPKPCSLQKYMAPTYLDVNEEQKTALKMLSLGHVDVSSPMRALAALGGFFLGDVPSGKPTEMWNSHPLNDDFLGEAGKPWVFHIYVSLREGNHETW